MVRYKVTLNLPVSFQIPLQLVWRVIIFFSQGGVVSFWVLYIFLLFIAFIFPFAVLGGKEVDASAARAIAAIFSVVFFQVDAMKNLISPSADFSMHADQSSLAAGIGTWFFIGGLVNVLYSRIKNAMRKSRGLPAIPEKEPLPYFSFLKRVSIPWAIGMVVALIFGGWVTALAYAFFCCFLLSLSLSYPIRNFAEKKLRSTLDASQPPVPILSTTSTDTPPADSLPR